MREKFVDFIRSLRDPVRARRQEKIHEVELTWSDHDLANFRVFALGIQPAEMADVCHALADGSAIPLLELLVDYAELNDELMQIAFQSLEKTPLSARLYLSDRLLASENSLVRSAACKMLSGAAPAADKLKAALADGSEMVAAAAIDSLVAIGDGSAADRILPLLSRGSVELRLRALDALNRFRASSSAFETAALRMAESPEEDREVRRRAVLALAGMRSAGGRRLVLAQLADGGADPETRRTAVRALGSFPDPEAAAALLEAAKGDIYPLADAALRSLSRMDPSVTVPVCETALAGSDAGLAMAATDLLGGLDVPEAGMALAAGLDGEQDPARMAALAEALGKSGYSGAWSALKAKLESNPERAAPLIAALADCARAEDMDEFAALVDDLRDSGAVEMAMRRLAAFCRAVRPTPKVRQRMIGILDSGDPALVIPAVEILAYSGTPSLRRRILAEIAGHAPGLPVRRLLRTLLEQNDGHLAALFADMGPEVAALVVEAAPEADGLGRDGSGFLARLAEWVRHDVPGAREGLAAAAELEPSRLADAMASSPDWVCLLEAWAGLSARERLLNDPDLDGLFAAGGREDRLRALDILSRVGEERHLRPVAMLAFGERDPAVKAEAARLTRRLLGFAPDAEKAGAP